MTRRRPRTLAAPFALAIGLAVTLAACGGDDDDGGGSSSVTKDEFIAEADAVCEDYEARFEAAVEDVDENATPEEAAELVTDEVLPLFREQIDALRDLDVPEADADEIQQFWDDLEAATDDAEQQIADDPNVLFQSENDPFADVNERLTAYGLETCGD